MEKDNRLEAENLIKHAKEKYHSTDGIIPLLRNILTGKPVKMYEEGWHWELVKFVEEHTNYITVNQDFAHRLVTDTSGTIPPFPAILPINMTVAVNDRENLMDLNQEVDDILNNISEKITKFLAMENKPKWVCQNQNCGRFLGKELSSVEEIKKLLGKFSIGIYRKCRSCLLLNYFVITNTGIEFKIRLTLDEQNRTGIIK